MLGSLTDEPETCMATGAPGRNRAQLKINNLGMQFVILS
jgi:hypothetical protein